MKDLYDEDEILGEMAEQGFEKDEKRSREDKKRNKKLSDKQLEQINDEKFKKEYYKAGGIQHIICSATLTIDKQGRVTPRGVEKEKRMHAKAKEKGLKIEETISTVDQLCKILNFRSKQPKVIDLTEEQRMPSTLHEYAVRCSRDEKDLYMYYYLS